ncbi:MAG: hypothetical protein QHI48_04660 [Bacteroidota bacterium]|nr:hypothetical protein [Bacteroidota bacterium]
MKHPLSSLFVLLLSISLSSCSTTKITVSGYGMVGGEWVRGSSFRLHDCSGHLSIGSKPVILTTAILSAMSGVFLSVDCPDNPGLDPMRWAAFAAAAVSFWMYATSPVLDLQEGHYPYFESDEPDIRPGEKFPQSYRKYVTVENCMLIFSDIPRKRYVKLMVNENRFITVDTKSLPR